MYSFTTVHWQWFGILARYAELPTGVLMVHMYTATLTPDAVIVRPPPPISFWFIPETAPEWVLFSTKPPSLRGWIDGIMHELTPLRVQFQLDEIHHKDILEYPVRDVARLTSNPLAISVGYCTNILKAYNPRR